MPTLLKSWDGGEGAGKIVEIDESCFGRSQYNRGRIRSTMGVWRCQAGVGGTFLVPVPYRSVETLLGVINTTIIGDCWAAYVRLGDEGFTHHTVTRRRLRGCTNCAHTSITEATWKHVKVSVCTYSDRAYCIFYLAKNMFGAFSRTPKSTPSSCSSTLSEVWTGQSALVLCDAHAPPPIAPNWAPLHIILFIHRCHIETALPPSSLEIFKQCSTNSTREPSGGLSDALEPRRVQRNNQGHCGWGFACRLPVQWQT